MRVKYLLVGGYAVAYYGYPRYTKDIDIWIECEERNAEKIIKLLKDFGFSSENLKKEDFLKEENIIQLGYPPTRIDILTSIDGVNFKECYDRKNTIAIDDVEVNIIDIEDLKKNKKASKRYQDLADLERLGEL